VALKNVPEGKTFDLYAGPDERPFGTFTSGQLTSGVDISLPDKGTAEVLLILPHAD
jgi:hypothetical protein